MKFEYRILSKVLIAFLVTWTIFLIFFYNSLENNLNKENINSSKNHLEKLNLITKNHKSELLLIAKNISDIIFNSNLGEVAKSREEIEQKLDSLWLVYNNQFSSLTMSYYDDKHNIIRSWGTLTKSQSGYKPNLEETQLALESGKGTAYFSCIDICYFNVSRPIAPYTFQQGIIQITIPIENIILKFQELNKPHVTLYRKLSEKTPEKTSMDIQTVPFFKQLFAFQSTSSIINYEEISPALNKIKKPDQQVIKLNKKTYSFYFDTSNLDNHVLFMINEDITDRVAALKQTFYQVFFGSLILLIVLAYILHLLLHKIIKRLNSLSSILPIIGKGDFDEAEKALQQSIETSNVSNPDELDSLHDSAKVLTNKLRELHNDLTTQNQKLRVMADYDAMTKVYNRRKYMERVYSIHHLGIPFSLVNIDMDHFKLVNDTMGHTVGDELLQKVAKILLERVSNNGIVGRMGGDEFALMILGENKSQVISILDNITEDVALITFDKASNLSIKVGLSMGISLYPVHSEDLNELITFADAAMYENKKHKQNAYNFYTGQETILQSEEKLHYWNTLILDALKNNLVNAFFQPIVKQSDHHEIVAYEVLARIMSSRHQTANDARFIPYAEKTHAIIQVDKRMIALALERTNELSPQPLLMINLSNITLATPRMSQYILEQITKYNYSPDKIVIEITESAEAIDLNHSDYFIRELQQVGIRFALDDFGTGFSSFNYISRLKIDYIKIDKTFVQGLNDPERSHINYRIIESIVFLAKNLQTQIIAEGIENKELLAQMSEFDIDLLQGYYFAIPSPNLPSSTELSLAQKRSANN